MAHLQVTFHDNMIDVLCQGVCWKLPNIGKNKKILLEADYFQHGNVAVTASGQTPDPATRLLIGFNAAF